ncbi:DNA translocase FtsK [Lonsdalea quercina]|uniref:DNA translocase FtsK n=1 Tax=Lonsdalea quercina TaxID=71657 RepID=UPI003975D5AF
MSEQERDDLNRKMDAELYDKTLQLIIHEGLTEIKVKTVQLYFRVGYNRAARIVERLRLEKTLNHAINKD